MPRFFILEHPTRGTLRDFEGEDYRPRFSWRGRRSDWEYARRYGTIRQALADRERIREKVGDRVAEPCKVRRSGDWQVVA